LSPERSTGQAIVARIVDILEDSRARDGDLEDILRVLPKKPAQSELRGECPDLGAIFQVDEQGMPPLSPVELPCFANMP
jgi:hypothetical protein